MGRFRSGRLVRLGEPKRGLVWGRIYVSEIYGNGGLRKKNKINHMTVNFKKRGKNKRGKGNAYTEEEIRDGQIRPYRQRSREEGGA